MAKISKVQHLRLLKQDTILKFRGAKSISGSEPFKLLPRALQLRSASVTGMQNISCGHDIAAMHIAQPLYQLLHATRPSA